MNTRRTALAVAAAAALTFSHPVPAPAATEGRLRLELLVDGRPVREHHSRGTTYVEARRGREYSLRVTNLEDARVAVALAVDGRNTIDGRRTSAEGARKWILGPWESIVVTGWQVGEDRARRFYFTTEDRSYAEWLGDTRNVGVIEAVAFRERPRPQAWNEPWWRGRDEAASAPGAAGSQAPPSASAERSAKAQRAPAPGGLAKDAESDDAATGIGRDVRNDVVRVEFEQESRASSSVRLRYEYRERLVELGILPEHDDHDDRQGWRKRERATGFDDWCPEPR